MLRKFQINVIIKVILLIITIGIFFLTLKTPDHLFSIALTGSLIIIQTALLIRYVTRVNRDLKQFHLSILNQDGTIQLQTGGLSKDQELNDTLNDVTTHLSSLKREKEIHYHYLKHIVNHLNTGVLAFTPDGKVDMINKSALDLLGINKLGHLDELNRYGEDFMNRLWYPSVTGNDLIELKKEYSTVNFSVRSSMFKLNNQTVQLLSFQNIRDELESNELQSWRKLLRVITHEIMNSVSPIVSLSTTLNRLYLKNGNLLNSSEIKKDHIKDTIEGLQIIKRRSTGLLSFVKNIRKIHLLPKPVFEEINVKEIFDGISMLMKEEIANKNIKIQYRIIPENLKIYADKNLIEQVLLNLTKNSIEAIDKEGKIEMKAFYNEEDYKKYIKIVDNGKGIEEPILQEIFIPFFTTKKDGSGIGLSLCRQIMKLHAGSISVISEKNSKTEFTLKFQK